MKAALILLGAILALGAAIKSGVLTGLLLFLLFVFVASFLARQ